MEDLKALIQEKILKPAQNPERYSLFRATEGFGVLLYGPPGTGKTHFVRAIAGELDCPFFAIRYSDIVSKWVGDTQKNLAALMKEAKSHSRSIVFIDEIDGLFPERSGESSSSDQRVNAFLEELSGLEPRESWLLVIGATNRPGRVDRALIRSGRLSTHIYVGPPDEQARERILEINLKDVPVAEDVNLNEIAKRSDGYSAADVAQIAIQARSHAAGRDGTEQLEMLDLEAGFQRVSPVRPSSRMLKEIEEFREMGLLDRRSQ